MPHTWYKLGDAMKDHSGDLYYHGQKIKEAYYRGEKIWGDKFLGILLVNLPDTLHYPVYDLFIKMNRLPNKTEYQTGEPFDYTGASVAAVYENGLTYDVTAESVFIPASEAFDGDGGERPEISFPISYHGLTIFGVWESGKIVDITEECEFYPESGKNITEASNIVGILVKKLPDKIEYEAGEPFDYTGAVVAAVSSNGTESDVTLDCSFTAKSKRPPYALGIFVTKYPTKRSYSPSEEIVYDGVEIKFVYSNGLSFDVTDDCSFESAM